MTSVTAGMSQPQNVHCSISGGASGEGFSAGRLMTAQLSFGS